MPKWCSHSFLYKNRITLFAQLWNIVTFGAITWKLISHRFQFFRERHKYFINSSYAYFVNIEIGNIHFHFYILFFNRWRLLHCIGTIYMYSCWYIYLLAGITKISSIGDVEGGKFYGAYWKICGVTFAWCFII